MFFEHGYLTYYRTYLFAKICIKGTVFQNLDLGFSFCICYVEVGILKDNYKKLTKVTCFLS